MSWVKAILGTLAFLFIYGLVDWLAGVTAPVLGPLLLAGIIAFLVWLMVRLAKAGK